MKKYIFLLLTGLFLSLHTFSQTVGITDFMRLNPYSSLNNPAYFMPYKGYVGIPGISNINFSLYNSGFIFKNLVDLDKNLITPNKFVKSLHPKQNWFNMNLNMELLGFGFRVKDYFFSFSYRLRMEENFRYSRDLFGFILQGNLAQNKDGSYLYTEATPANLEISPNFNFYQEMSIGFQGKITDRLYVGARPKILFGLVNVKTNKLGLKLYSDPEDFTIFGTYNVDMKAASVMPFYTKDADGNITLDTESIFDYKKLVRNVFSKNLGFAIDLGAVYRVNQQIRVSASVTDLGFIKWKGSSLNIFSNPLNNSFKFEGLNTDQIINLIENGIDISMDDVFDIVNEHFSIKEMKSYTTMLTSKVMLDGYFDLTPCNRFILQFKGYIMGKSFLPQFTVAYNGTFFNVFDVVVSYSMMRKSFDNLGVGLGIRMGPVHLYAGTDNVLAAVNILNATRMNFTTGLLINFPVRAKVKEAQLKGLFRTKEAVPVSEPVQESANQETTN